MLGSDVIQLRNQKELKHEIAKLLPKVCNVHVVKATLSEDGRLLKSLASALALESTLGTREK